MDRDDEKHVTGWRCPACGSCYAPPAMGGPVECQRCAPNCWGIPWPPVPIGPCEDCSRSTSGHCWRHPAATLRFSFQAPGCAQALPFGTTYFLGPSS